MKQQERELIEKELLYRKVKINITDLAYLMNFWLGIATIGLIFNHAKIIILGFISSLAFLLTYWYFLIRNQKIRRFIMEDKKHGR